MEQPFKTAAEHQQHVYVQALSEIAQVINDPRIGDAEKVRTIRRILRTIGMIVGAE